MEIQSAECRVWRLALVGFEGMGRYNYRPLLSDESFVILCEALANNSSVLELDVRSNGLSDTSAAALARLLASNRSLRSVDFSGNFVTARGLHLVARGLRDNQMIDRLVLVPQLEPMSLTSAVPAVALDDALDRVAGALSNALTRKKELLSPSEKGSIRLHGFLTQPQAEALLLSVQPSVRGLYLFYLCAHRPDTVQVAYTVDVAGTVVHRTIYRHNEGYSCTPRISSLSRYAAWQWWAANGAVGLPVRASVPEREEVAAAREMFLLWQVELLDDLDDWEACGGEGRLLQPQMDPPDDVHLHYASSWEGTYPSLYFFTSALRAHLKVGLMKSLEK